MRLFEYQAKGIFQDYGIPIPNNQVTSNAALTEQIRDEIGKEVVLKAQVLIHGRSKAGGIRLIRPKEDIVNAASEILNLSIKGNKVRKILIEEAIQVEREIFLKIEIDPYLEKPVLIASKFDVKKSLANGMEATESRIRIPIEFSLGLLDHHKRKIAVTLELSKEIWEKFSLILTSMWKIFKEMDAISIEINPLVIDEKNQFLALGAAIEIDDRALFRHSAIQERQEPSDESLLKIEAEKFGITTSQFEGVIGCIVNEVSLGYAIEDILFSKGSHLGILMDAGRGASEEKISAGLDILFRNRKTKCILLTIFGGLTQCDRVASGIIRSITNTSRNKPLVIYLKGTNSEAGKYLLRQSNLNIEETLVASINKCLDLVKAGK